jgi:hypothetical protein
LEKDLFFAVKIRDTLRHHDIEANIVRTLSAFEQRIAANDENNEGQTRPALAIVNTATVGLDWEAAIRAARAQGLPVLAFGSHMDLEAREKALQAGAQQVVANSKFTSDMYGLVSRFLEEKGA